MTKNDDKLGILERVDLRDYWGDEARDFTPWLSEPQNLALLSKTIEMDLELVRRESSVGSFSADILAKDSDTDQYVVIENQLEKTNHPHLGQLLTYASGLEAKAVIWIAKEFREEHRKALDWLNEVTAGDVGFFGIEVELWKIGNSAPAPKFNLVCKPNGWAKSLKPSTNAAEQTETKVLQLAFWTELVEFFEKKKTSMGSQKPRPRHWYDIAVGRSHFHIALTVNSQKKRVGCELYIKAPESKPAFAQLKEEKTAIEKEIGAKLEWNELPHRGASRIVQYRPGNFEDRSQWPELFEWLKDRAESFHKAFSKRVAELDLDDERGDEAA